MEKVTRISLLRAFVLAENNARQDGLMAERAAQGYTPGSEAWSDALARAEAHGCAAEALYKRMKEIIEGPAGA